MVKQPLFTNCPKEKEAALINRCAQTGRGFIVPADNIFIAGTYRLSSFLLASTNAEASKFLLIESERYFEVNPDQCITIEKVLASRAIIDLSRFSAKLLKALGVSSYPTTLINTNIEFQKCLEKLFVSLEKKLLLNKKVKIYIAGDAATYFYTRNRLRPAVEIDFDVRFPSPGNTFTILELQDHVLQLLYIDVHYNPKFKLLHDDYKLDSKRFDLGLSMIELYILKPIDLAVSKVLSDSEHDKRDISDIIQLGLASRQEILNRGMEAISSLICNQSEIRKNYLAALERCCSHLDPLRIGSNSLS